MRQELSSQATSLETKHSRSVEAEKENHRSQLKDLQWKYEAELNELQAKNVKLTQQLENRVASLDVQNRDLWEVRVGHEASLREARGQLACREEEVTRLRRDVAALRQEKQVVETIMTMMMIMTKMMMMTVHYILSSLRWWRVRAVTRTRSWAR